MRSYILSVYFFFSLKVTQQTQPQLVLAGPQPSPTTATMIPTAQGLLLNQVIITIYLFYVLIISVISACSLYNNMKMYIHHAMLYEIF